MAFQIKNKSKLVAEINVTPLVDVMLVLLVIFMITAPLMLNGIQLNLPKTKEVNRINLTTNQVVLSYTKKGEYFLGKNRLTETDLVKKIKSEFSKTSSETLFLRADYSVSYGSVAKIMSKLKKNGIGKIALVTETEQE